MIQKSWLVRCFLPQIEGAELISFLPKNIRKVQEVGPSCFSATDDLGDKLSAFER